MDTRILDTRILIVDDDSRLAQALAMVLEDEGYQVSLASDGMEALKQVWTSVTPALIVLDWNMPRMSGLEVCRRLRQAGYERPIVFSSGMGDRPHCIAALSAGANAYLVKPFTADELLTTIAAMLQQPFSCITQCA